MGEVVKSERTFQSIVNGVGSKTFFIQLKQGDFSWWKPIDFTIKAKKELEKATNWDLPLEKSERAETISLSSYFNAKVTDIFTNEYLSPRPQTVTLQLPKQGIGNWCYPNISCKN